MPPNLASCICLCETVRGHTWSLVGIACDVLVFIVRVLRSNLQDLKDTTDKVHYETFRRNRLQSSGYVGESNI